MNGKRFGATLLGALIGAMTLAATAWGTGTPPPVAHLDASADVIWVWEHSDYCVANPAVPSCVVSPGSVGGPGRVEITAIDTNATPGAPDDVTTYLVTPYVDPPYPLGSPPSITVDATWAGGGAVRLAGGPPETDFLVVDGGAPGNAVTGPAGWTGVAPTTDYVQFRPGKNPFFDILGFVQCGYIRLSFVPVGAEPLPLPVDQECRTTQQTRYVAPPVRALYVAVEGNTDPFTGKPIKPGTMLDLLLGQPLTDPHYTNAQPAIYVEGVGLTAGPPPPGYVQHGLAGNDQHVAGDLYPYFTPTG